MTGRLEASVLRRLHHGEECHRVLHAEVRETCVREGGKATHLAPLDL